MATRKRKTTKKKRTLTPEQLEKMKQGRERKKQLSARQAGISELEKRLRNASRQS